MIDSVAGDGEAERRGDPTVLPSPAAGGGERLVFVLPTFPPSINRNQKIDHVRRRVGLSDELLLWRTRTIPFVKPCRWPSDWLLAVTLIYESPFWVCKNGNLRKKDSHNLDKNTIDLLFAKWGWGDERVVDLTSRKRYGPREQIQVILERSLVQLTEVG